MAEDTQRYNKIEEYLEEKLQSQDEYIGKTIAPNENANLDHTVSRKEIYENKLRRQAGIVTEDLANKSKNLNL